jgi:hypothetical protein
VSHWYTAVIVLQARVGDGWQDEFLLDHQVHLIHATDPEAAFARAIAIGKAEALVYRNDRGESVSWAFAGLADLEELTADPSDGVEVWSWRARGQSSAVVVAKEQLSVFYRAANATRTAEDLLDDEP